MIAMLWGSMPANTRRRKIGELLLDAGLITQSQIDTLLLLQEEQRVPLGELAVRESGVSALHVYQLLATQMDLPFINLYRSPPARHLLRSADIEDYLRYRFVPWRKDERGVLYVATSDVSVGMRNWLQQRYGVHVVLVMTSPRDIVRAVERHFSGHIARLAKTKLHHQSPHYSALRQRRYVVSALLCCAIVMVWLVVFASMFGGSAMVWALWIGNVSYLAAISYKVVLLYHGAKALREFEFTPSVALDEALLPHYSVLVPLYREAQSVPSLIASLSSLDYPKSKLDIKLIIEYEDKETLQAVISAQPSSMFELVIVPAMQPRTKPKACNYALTFVRGEFVVIFDAEDRPEPDQLKRAVSAFARMPEDVACLQARLGYYNRDENLLTRWFSLEYGMLFGLLLGGLSRLRMPLPLGGTSNHFRTSLLRQVGEWDAYNVTEDADLGIRLAARGYRTCMLNSWTWEEAPTDVAVWLRQRSRWIKGYLQTWAVHMRHPVRLYRNIGFLSFFGFQLFFALSSFVYFFAPWLWGIAFWQCVVLGKADFSSLGCVMAGSVFVGGFLVQWFGAEVTLLNVRWCYAGGWKMLLALLFFPLYGVLHSLASIKAVWQFIRKPYYWEKTPHGVCRKLRALKVSA